MLVLRSLVFNVLFYLLLIACMVIGSPALVLGPARVRALARFWARLSLVLLRAVCGLRVEFRGLQNIPEGAVIVAAKHQSFLEVFALVTVFPAFTFVLKRELTRIPLFGWYLGCSGQIAIDRARGRAALAQVADKSRAIFAEGRQLLIFPEGTRRPPGAPAQYKFGAAFVYAESHVPCLPVAVNSGLFWSRKSFVKRPGTVVIDIMPPIAPGLPPAEVLRLLENRIEGACARLNEEAVRADPGLARVLHPGATVAAPV